MNGDDVTLVEGFRVGRPQVLEQIYREHRRSIEALVRTSLRRAGLLSRENRADLVQDIFARAFSAKARASYDGARSFTPFLRQIARNILIDWHRHKTYEREGLAELDLEVAASPRVYEPFEGSFSDDMVAAARGFVAALEPELHAVHECRFVAAETQERAARSLGISRQNLRTLERRLLDVLREVLLSA